MRVFKKNTPSYGEIGSYYWKGCATVSIRAHLRLCSCIAQPRLLVCVSIDRSPLISGACERDGSITSYLLRNKEMVGFVHCAARSYATVVLDDLCARGAAQEACKKLCLLYIANFKMANIPVVSLVGDEEEVVGKLDAAFRGVGFVFVVDHSIPPQQVRLY